MQKARVVLGGLCCAGAETNRPVRVPASLFGCNGGSTDRCAKSNAGYILGTTGSPSSMDWQASKVT